MKKGTLATAVAGAALAALTLSGCTATPGPEAKVSSVASSAPATPSATPSPTPTQLVPGYTGTPAPPGKPVAIGDKAYLQSTIADDDPAMVLNPGLVHQESTAYFTPDDLQAALATIVKFTAEEGIDSTLNGGLETPDQWWARNKDRFHPNFEHFIYEEIASARAFVLNEAWQKQYDGRYKYITAADKTRVQNRSITVNSVWSPSPGTVAVQMDVNFEMLATPNIGKIGTGIQSSSGNMTYSATKDESGTWLIDGYDHEMYTTEG